MGDHIIFLNLTCWKLKGAGQGIENWHLECGLAGLIQRDLLTNNPLRELFSKNDKIGGRKDTEKETLVWLTLDMVLQK